jgi:ribose transport system ATP-binding protein
LPSPSPAIEIERIRKTFGATVAVDEVSFAVPAGTVRALLGENGAGKSTIVKLLSGLVQPDAGAIRIDGQDVSLRSPRDSQALGIQTAFQEMTLVKDLTVLDNMLLPTGPLGPLGRIRRREAQARIEAHLDAIDVHGIELAAEIRDLDLAQQQKIEIARALWREPRILLLDEPTSTLSGRDIDWLGELIARVRAAGRTVVFISHRLREVRMFCDELTVLRNGRDIATARVDEVEDDEVIRMIVGRSLASTFPPRPPAPAVRRPAALAARDLRVSPRLMGVSFELAPGEVLGIAGLQGMGQLELFLACFGMVELDHGTLEVDGAPVAITSPVDAVRARLGISLVPEDRKTEALFLKLDGTRNASLPTIERFTRGGLIDREREEAAVAAVFERVQVDRRALWTRVSAFSGGNQQKIAIAKWLLAESRILLLFDPTRGIDVGTKHELYVLIREFADAGGAVLFYSTEIPEIVGLADRALVLYAGRVARELVGDEINEDAIVRAALGGGVGEAA